MAVYCSKRYRLLNPNLLNNTKILVWLVEEGRILVGRASSSDAIGGIDILSIATQTKEGGREILLLAAKKVRKNLLVRVN